MKETNKDSLKETIIEDTLKYSSSQYGSQFINIISSVLMTRILGPYNLGIWSMLKIVLSYCGYSILGVNKAAVYKIPFYIGKGDTKSAEEVKDLSFSFILLASFVVSIGLISVGFIFMKSWPIEWIAGLFAISVFMILNRIYLFYILLLRAKGNFSVISKGIIFDAIMNLILVVTLVRGFSLYGLFFVICILAVLNTLFLYFLSRYTIKFRFQLKGILELIKYGIPLLLLSVLNMILRTVDRIMIANMLGITFVGYYSIAIMGRNYATGISSHLGVVSIPRILGEYGKRENMDDIKKFVIVPTKTVAYLMAPFLALIFFTAPLIVEIFLPQYIPGILSLQILLISVFFSSCHSQTMQFIIAINKKEKLVVFSILAVLLNILLNYIFIKIGYGIYGVALGTSLTSFFVFLIIQYYAMAQFEEFKKIVSFFIILLIPFVYILCSVLLIESLIYMQNLYVETLFKIMILSIIALPLFIYIDKDTGVLKSIFKIIRLKLKF